jgi:hypothetical protein
MLREKDISLSLPYLEVTVFVQQDITGLQISVNDSCRVDVLECSQNLVKEVLDMLNLKFLL